MTTLVGDALLDDADALAAADPGGLLRAVATAGPQVREATTRSLESGVRAVAEEGRPRAVVVAGMGTAGLVGDLLASCLGPSCPVPVTVVRDFALPGWVGPLDLVVAVSCYGRTAETLAVAEEAARRGCRLLCISATGSPLHRLAVQAGAAHLPVAAGDRPSRTNLWAMAVPALLAADALRLLDVAQPVLQAAADRLDAEAARCAPGRDASVNPAKHLASDLVGCVPLVWGSGQLGSVLAARMAGQLAENAKVPASWAALPDAGHSAVAALDAPSSAGAAASEEDDFFRDRVDDPVDGPRLAVLLLRDLEDPRGRHRSAALQSVAEQRGVLLRTLTTDGEHVVERLASMIAITDFTAVYVGLAAGIDPLPTRSVEELARRAEHFQSTTTRDGS